MLVEVDEIGQRRFKGMVPDDAVAISVRRLLMQQLASTVTTVLSFLPMILLPGPAGDFVESIATAVVVMLVWSFLVAVAVTPAMAGRALKAPDTAPRPDHRR